LALLCSTGLHADETCMSPYMAKIVGQEDYVYVWTLGVEGLGDEQDKLVTIDVRPDSETYGQVVESLSVGGRNEAHHSGFTDDRRFLWASGLDTSKIFIFDVHTDPGKPKLVRTIDDFVEKSGGVVGPHTNYALPGRMMLTGLSNSADHGGRTALVEYTNDGDYITTHWMPTDDSLQGAVKSGNFADGYGYDVRVLPRRNVMITSSFTGWNNYMMNLGTLMADAEAMQRFGNTVVVWNLHTRKPQKTSKIWLIYEDDAGEWQAKEVADIGDASLIPLPVDISISADDQQLWVNTWNDGKTRLYDISDPHAPVQVMEEQIGAQVNMVSQSWDGERVYFTSSLLANWDKVEAPEGEDLQYFKAYDWQDGALEHAFTIDFLAAKLGTPHQMRFGAYALYGL
jgi:selenium-binding protein 1